MLRQFIEGNRAPGESFSTAATRFSLLANVSLPTLWVAIKGRRVGPRSARRIEEASGGAIQAALLLSAPRKGEQ